MTTQTQPLPQPQPSQQQLPQPQPTTPSYGICASQRGGTVYLEDESRTADIASVFQQLSQYAPFQQMLSHSGVTGQRIVGIVVRTHVTGQVSLTVEIEGGRRLAFALDRYIQDGNIVQTAQYVLGDEPIAPNFSRPAPPPPLPADQTFPLAQGNPQTPGDQREMRVLDQCLQDIPTLIQPLNATLQQMPANDPQRAQIQQILTVLTNAATTFSQQRQALQNHNLPAAQQNQRIQELENFQQQVLQPLLAPNQNAGGQPAVQQPAAAAAAQPAAGGAAAVLQNQGAPGAPQAQAVNQAAPNLNGPLPLQQQAAHQAPILSLQALPAAWQQAHQHLHGQQQDMLQQFQQSQYVAFQTTLSGEPQRALLFTQEQAMLQGLENYHQTQRRLLAEYYQQVCINFLQPGNINLNQWLHDTTRQLNEAFQRWALQQVTAQHTQLQQNGGQQLIPILASWWNTLCRGLEQDQHTYVQALNNNMQRAIVQLLQQQQAQPQAANPAPPGAAANQNANGGPPQNPNPPQPAPNPRRWWTWWEGGQDDEIDWL